MTNSIGDTVERAHALLGPLDWDETSVNGRGELVLPSGTVTLLLADVEGSTRGWEERAQEMTGALEALGEIVDATLGWHQGARPVEQGEGDSFVAAFSRASDAVACALEIQRQLTRNSLRLRMGVHTGEVQLRDEGNYVGPALNRTARLRDAAHGGQVVLSQATCELVRDRLPDGAALRDLGVHRLKDLGRPEHVYQLVHPELGDHFPPLRSVDHLPNNLPAQLTSFVGREPELAVLRKLLGETRMLTLTGSGGCGKTRLALELAARALERFPDGTWLVELTPITDASLVPSAVAAAVGAREQQGRRALDVLVDDLASQTALVLLDNCEHLVDATAEVAERILLACPGVVVLVTSREQLGVPGETAWRVPSLSFPERAGAAPRHAGALRGRAALPRARPQGPAELQPRRHDSRGGCGDLPAARRRPARGRARGRSHPRFEPAADPRRTRRSLPPSDWWRAHGGRASADAAARRWTGVTSC